MNLVSTLGNEDWMEANADALQRLLPATWTHMANLSLLRIGFELKVLGVDWRTEAELTNIMVFFERSGLMQRENFLVRANPNFPRPGRG